MKKTIIFIIIILSLLMLVSCKKKDDAKQADSEEINRDATYVTINGEVITNGEYKDYISYDYAMMDPEKRDNKAVLRAFRDDFIQHRLLLQQAVKDKITIDEKQFDAMMASFKSKNGEKIVNEFEQQLDINFDTVREQLHQRALVSELISRKTGNIEISDSELMAYYKKHKSELTVGERAHILHIVTEDEGKAKEALLMLKKGISFAEVAQKYSVAPEAADGGDLGMVDIKEYPAIFQDALKLKIGQTSGILKSDYGYHIFKLLAVQKQAVPTFDDVKDELEDEIYSIKQDKILKDYMDELYKKSKIVYPSGASGAGSTDKP